MTLNIAPLTDTDANESVAKVGFINFDIQYVSTNVNIGSAIQAANDGIATANIDLYSFLFSSLSIGIKLVFLSLLFGIEFTFVDDNDDFNNDFNDDFKNEFNGNADTIVNNNNNDNNNNNIFIYNFINILMQCKMILKL